MWGFWLKLGSWSSEGSFGFQRKALILCVSEIFSVFVLGLRFGLQLRGYSAMKNWMFRHMHTCVFIPQTYCSKTILLGEHQLRPTCFKMELHFSWLRKKKGTNFKIACLLSVGFYLHAQKRGSWKVKSLANMLTPSLNWLLWQVTFSCN